MTIEQCTSIVIGSFLLITLSQSEQWYRVSSPTGQRSSEQLTGTGPSTCHEESTKVRISCLNSHFKSYAFLHTCSVIETELSHCMRCLRRITIRLPSWNNKTSHPATVLFQRVHVSGALVTFWHNIHVWFKAALSFHFLRKLKARRFPLTKVSLSVRSINTLRLSFLVWITLYALYNFLQAKPNHVSELYVHVTVHRDKFPYNRTKQM
jgi:hypothetical protein